MYLPKSHSNQYVGPSVLTNEPGQPVCWTQYTYLRATVANTAASFHLTACPTDERRSPYPTPQLSDQTKRTNNRVSLNGEALWLVITNFQLLMLLKSQNPIFVCVWGGNMYELGCHSRTTEFTQCAHFFFKILLRSIGTQAPLPRIQVLSFSCSFGGNIWPNKKVFAPTLEVGAPNLGNPGSTTV